MNAPLLSRPLRHSRILRGAVLTVVAGFALASCGGALSPQDSMMQVTTHAVALTWTASISPVSGYVVYRSTDPGGPFLPVTTTLAGAIQYVDTNVAAGQTYFYYVTAYDSSNVESVPSSTVSATVPPS